MATHSSFPPATPETMRAEHQRYFTFFNISLMLAGLTFIELILIVLPFTGTFLYTSLVFLSLIKFAAVIWYFMHLKWDQMMLSGIFISGLLLASLTVIALILIFQEEITNLRGIDGGG
jgi:cytochrome c oxidase subunit IV